MNKTIVNDWWQTKRHELKKDLSNHFKHKSPMQTTDIIKVVINSGVGQAVKNEQLLINTKTALSRIAQGQKPITTRAKKSIINFKIRTGMPIGCKVTLRKEKAWNFLFELININFALINNFRGFSKKKFDKDGNYNIGLNGLDIFPQVPFDQTFKNQGIQVTINFKSDYKVENQYFLERLHFPFNSQ